MGTEEKFHKRKSEICSSVLNILQIAHNMLRVQFVCKFSVIHSTQKK